LIVESENPPAMIGFVSFCEMATLFKSGELKNVNRQILGGGGNDCFAASRLEG
jgi:hypothetical protein